MGECINLRRGGKAKALPVLNPNFPADVSCMRNNGVTTLRVEFAEHGYPAEYTYQWYKNGSAISGATSSTYAFSLANAVDTYTFYCKVTNAAGTAQSRTATITLRNTYLWDWGDVPENCGGWVQTTCLAPGEGSGAVGSMSVVEGQLRMTLTDNNASVDGAVRTYNKIDLTHYSAIEFYVYCKTNDTDYSFFLAALSHHEHIFYHSAAKATVPYSANNWYTVTLDVSGLTGEYYVGVYTWIYNDYSEFSIGRIQLKL